MTESGGPGSYDAGKKVKGRKRGHGGHRRRGLILEPQPADAQDRDGGAMILRMSRRVFPFITKTFADSGYAGERAAAASIKVDGGTVAIICGSSLSGSRWTRAKSA